MMVKTIGYGLRSLLVVTVSRQWFFLSQVSVYHVRFGSDKVAFLLSQLIYEGFESLEKMRTA